MNSELIQALSGLTRKFALDDITISEPDKKISILLSHSNQSKQDVITAIEAILAKLSLKYKIRVK